MLNKNKTSLRIMFLSLLFTGMVFAAFFYQYRCLPLSYDIDTFVYYRITRSILQLDFPAAESIGMSPLFPLAVLPMYILTGLRESLFLTNIMLFVIFITMLFFFTENYIGEKKAFILCVFCMIDPHIMHLIFTGYSEILAYVMIISGLFLFFVKERYFVSAAFFSLALLTRPEFLFLFPFLIIIRFSGKPKKIIKTALFFIIFVLTVNYTLLTPLTASDHNPFISKYHFIFFALEDYIKAENKEAFFSNIYFIGNETYSPERVNLFIEDRKKDIKRYIIKFPKYYIINTFLVIKTLFSNLWYYLVFIIGYGMISKNRQVLKYSLAFLTPIFIISSTPVESSGIRYFIYFIPIAYFCFIRLINNKISYIILGAFLIMFTFANVEKVFSEAANFNKELSILRENSISGVNLMTNISWLAFETDCTWIMPPPFAHNDKHIDFDHYVTEKKVDYLILDFDWRSLGSEFYNDSLRKYITETNMFRSVHTQTLFRVEKYED